MYTLCADATGKSINVICHFITNIPDVISLTYMYSTYIPCVCRENKKKSLRWTPFDDDFNLRREEAILRREAVRI